MAKLAKLFFLLFSTVSPKPLFLLLNNNNNNSSMDMEEGNFSVNPEVLIKSITLATIKTSSFGAKLNPLPIEPKLSTSEEPLSVGAGTEPALSPIMTMKGYTRVTSAMELTQNFISIFLIFAALFLIVVCLRGVRSKKKQAACVNQSNLQKRLFKETIVF